MVLITAATAAMAQDLNTAYFTKGYQYRHDMNPAFGNDKFYISVPALGNINFKLQGNIGIEDVLFKNPNPGGKATVTFMHPDISYEQAMAGINDKNKTLIDLRVSILSLGFKAFGGYNTLEVNVRNNFGFYLPGDLFRMAKGLTNKTYNFDFGVRDMAYAEVALGHSRQVNDALRVGAKVKALIGGGYADLKVKGLEADFRADQNAWYMHTGELDANVYMKGLELKNNPPGETFKDGRPDVHVDFGETDFDGAGISGFGGAVDLGAEYQVMEGLKVSAAILDLGLINWKNGNQLVQQNSTFTFDGFNDVAVKDEGNEDNKFSNTSDKYSDQLSEFINVQVAEQGGSKSKMLAPTVNIGAEYEMPFYKKLTAGLLLQRHFNGDYSWSEARISANVAPLKLFSFSASGAINNFGGSFGWLASIHRTGLALFIGMDHVITKTTKQMVPLRTNASMNIGLNVSF